MNLKQRLLLPATALSIAVTTFATVHYPNALQAQETDSLQLEKSAQIVFQPDDDNQMIVISDRAVYSLDNPALQFIYSPNQYVVEASGPSSEETAEAAISIIEIWSKEDYLTLKNAGDELGDFPLRLTVSVSANPEGLPLEDWISTLPNAILEKDGGTMERKSIAGQEGITFAREDMLTAYQSTVLKDATGEKVIMISVGGFHDAAQYDDSAAYQSAFEKIESSLRLTNASINEYKID